jgi:hypothetical protein
MAESVEDIAGESPGNACRREIAGGVVGVAEGSQRVDFVGPIVERAV